MSDARRLQIRRTAIAVLLFGSFVAAFWLVLHESNKDESDRLRKPGETCIYLASAQELCGPRAVEFCERTEARRLREDEEGRRTCERIRREAAGG